MTSVIVMGFHQIIVVMNDVKQHTYIHDWMELARGCLKAGSPVLYKYLLNQSFQHFFTNWICTKMLEDYKGSLLFLKMA